MNRDDFLTRMDTMHLEDGYSESIYEDPHGKIFQLTSLEEGAAIKLFEITPEEADVFHAVWDDEKEE